MEQKFRWARLSTIFENFKLSPIILQRFNILFVFVFDQNRMGFKEHSTWPVYIAGGRINGEAKVVKRNWSLFLAKSEKYWERNKLDSDLIFQPFEEQMFKHEEPEMRSTWTGEDGLRVVRRGSSWPSPEILENGQ